MAARSLIATQDGINQINRALTEKKWTREDLAEHCECSRQPAVKFCSGKSVSKKLFVSFCEALELDWEKIVGLKTAEAVVESEQAEPDIDALVQEIRKKVKDDIHHRCGTMRVLDMEQPIGIGDIYTSVNILEKLSGRRRLGIDELLQDCDLENFDRFMLGQVRHERVPGLEAVERYDKLMILGKPGAGKTTFMKRLATLCNQGEFQAQRVPVFVTLKEFSDKQGKPGLQAFIAQQWKACGVSDAASVKAVLDQGSALVLLDGLDEVQETDHDRVLQEIKSFTDRFRQCQFIVTCRIAAREYTFEQFTEVEVADFNQEQIEEFATKWFKTKQDPEKGENFIKRLKDNKPIQELATNPLLLTLLCLVFGDSNDFPPNRAELYKEGLDVLLKKWDAKRNIERDQVYKKLSLKRKEDLLSQLAFRTFERGDYFFKQAIVEQQIIDYIRNLPGAHEDEEALQLDGEAVLKSIEAQHGLLVERARGIYSFSHLTFQEYFTAKQIASSTTPLETTLKDLANQIIENRYREVILLAIEMSSNADSLMLSIKQQIDQLVMDDLNLQSLLDWGAKTSISRDVGGFYELAAMRAFYIWIALSRAFDITSSCLAQARVLALALALELDLNLVQNLDLEDDLTVTVVVESDGAFSFNTRVAYKLGHTYELGLVLDSILARALNISFVLDHALAYARDYECLDHVHDLDYSRFIARAHDRAYTRAHTHARNLNCVLALAVEKLDESEHELKLKIVTLKTQLPSIEDNDMDAYVQWWTEYGADWIRNLLAIMIKHRNIGHDWQLTDKQKERMQQYFVANRFLIECLNSDCYVTKATRQYIEDTLLLPMSEIEKYERPAL